MIVLPVAMGLMLGGAAGAAPVWVRLDLVENTAEGPAFDRCQIEATLERGPSKHWRVLYGDARADPYAKWSAIRSAAGCREVGPEPSATSWSLRGAPYFFLDVELRSATILDREIVVDAGLTSHRLTGFDGSGRPAYETSALRRTIRVPEGKSAVVPIVSASEREIEQFRVRELLLRFQAAVSGRKPAVEYGEIAVTADVPRAEVFVDGGFVGRTASDGPMILRAVRVGDREVIVRDASGREARVVTRVARGRQARVSLSVLKPFPSSADGWRSVGRNPQGGDELWREKDRALVVRIPGDDVRVESFLIDKTEVTWGQYKRFMATGQPPAKAPIWGMQDVLPVSGITWNEASAFCTWVGGRLPTEAEWERAAKSDDSRPYPWGETFDPWRCNTRDGGPHAPAPAASFPDCVGPYGVLDQAGGVSEWCSDWFADGSSRVSRGGDWMSAAQSVRVTSRSGVPPGRQGPMQGFRCVQADREAARTMPSPPAPQSARRIELQVDTVTMTAAGDESCEVDLVKDASSDRSFAAWSSWPGNRCGAGTVPDSSPAPLLIHELSATVSWSPGAMDPGPLGAVEVFLRFTTKERGSDAPKTDYRTIRLEPGEDFVIPLSISSGARDATGIVEALVHVRAGWAGRPGATRYGALAIEDALPGSVVRLDGGVAGRADADGGVLLSSVPVGLREARFQSAAGADVVRVVRVIEGRTVPVAAVEENGATVDRSLRSAGKNPRGFPEYERPRDGAVLIQIPEGEFLMGNLETEGAPAPHTVDVSSFLIDKLPLTNDRFRRFAAATARPLPPAPFWGLHGDFPVAFVRWDEARAYCEWVGGRLPSEAEREKAARGTDGRMFPWGNDPPSPERAVFGRYWGAEGNDAAGARPAGASPYGVLDPEGNMWEYCEDWWDPDYYTSSPRQDPVGPKTGRARVVRGGSWDSRWVALSASKRNFAFIGYREGDFGFRCAADPPR